MFDRNRKSKVASSTPSGELSMGEAMARDYHRYVYKKVLFIVGCIVAAIIVFAYAATYGSSDISMVDVYATIWNHFFNPDAVDPYDEWAIFTVRLPRICAGLIAGMSLGVAGAAMQSMMKNPLADPYTTGISSGASFGATLAIGLGITVGGAGDAGLILTAFVFSLIPAGVIILVSSLKHTSASTMILAGIAVMYLFNAATTLIKLGLSEQSLSAVFNWTVGDLSGTTWSDCRVMLVFTIVGTVILWALSKKLNILITGDKNAKALGLDAHKLRIVLLILISLMAASIVCFTGIIGFVGLVAPHIVRIFLGSDNRYLIPASAMFGAVLLMVADLISRWVIAPTFLPVGVITAFIGCPMFMYLLIKSRNSVW